VGCCVGLAESQRSSLRIVRNSSVSVRDKNKYMSGGVS
jgi:hypothetical protein